MSSSMNNKKALRRRAQLVIFFILIPVLVAVLPALGTTESDDSLSDYAIRSNTQTDPTYLAIGLRYGDDAPFSSAMLSPYGFIIGETEITKTERNFIPLYNLNTASLYAVCDSNIKVGYNSCSAAYKESDTDIGGYHVEITMPDGNIWDKLDDFSDLFTMMYGHCFPAYINGVKCVRVGAFAGYTEAGEAAAAVFSFFSGDEYAIGIASPSSSGVSVLDADMESILFEYDGDEHFYLGFAARQRADADRAYIQDVATSNIYDGLFCYRRYVGSGVDGLTHINLVELNTYVEGVLPNEIYTSWDIETQKAFAITVRSYSVICIGKHYSSYGFDMCSLSHCENYRGRKLITAKVTQAVKETHDMVLTYKDTVVEGLYSSSIGGWSVDTKYVWGGITDKYLTAQQTPWEKYSEYRSGMWESEISASELKKACIEYGETQIDSDIVKIETTYAGDTPYIYTMKLTDKNGNTATVTRCSAIRSLLYGYVWSANFSIGRGSVDYTYEDVISTNIINLQGSGAGMVKVYTGSGEILADSSKFNFFTYLGNLFKDDSSTLHVYTGNGIAQISGDGSDIPMTTEPDENGRYTVVSNYGSFLIVTQLQKHQATYRASSSTSFAIVGKGMGHGVGMSQFGASDLGEAGATAEQILTAYFPGAEIEDYYKFIAKNS